MQIKKHIPNAITCLNLLCGCVAIVCFSGGSPYGAWFVIGAAVADFLDGLAARALNVKSPIGKELDSLADVVSFGVAPGIMLLFIITDPILRWFGLLVPVFAALRLAKFNIDERQESNFIGLPSPASALFIISFPIIIAHNSFWHDFYVRSEVFSNWFFVSVAIVCSALMVLPVRLFSIKMKDFSWANNKFRYILAVFSVAGLVLLAYQAVPLIMVMYVLLSVIESKFAA